MGSSPFARTTKKEVTKVASFFCEVRSSAAAAAADCSANSSSQQAPNWATRISSRNSVPETASWGTEYACRAQNRLLGYAAHLRKHSVQKTGFYGTGEIFGTKNPLLWYGRDIRVVREATKRHRSAPPERRTTTRAHHRATNQPPGRKTTTGEKQPPGHKRGGHKI